MYAVKSEIARSIRYFAPNASSLLEVGADEGWQTLVYRSALSNPTRTVAYDWQDRLRDNVREAGVEFQRVDIEVDDFPDKDGSFDLVVCNQVLEHIKNIYRPLTEMHRVLKDGGLLLLSVPNMCALHNCALILFGRQPTTISLSGSHVRGYAVHSMSRFLTGNGHFRLRKLIGFGLHPFTSASLPGFLKTYCHTPLWVLQKQLASSSTWAEERARDFTTTKF